MSLTVQPIVAAKSAVKAPTTAMTTPSTSGDEQREGPPEQEHAGRDHGRRVDHGRHRRRAFHRVRQPDVQRELRRLADRAAEARTGPARGHPGRELAAVLATTSRPILSAASLPQLGELRRSRRTSK